MQKPLGKGIQLLSTDGAQDYFAISTSALAPLSMLGSHTGRLLISLGLDLLIGTHFGQFFAQFGLPRVMGFKRQQKKFDYGDELEFTINLFAIQYLRRLLHHNLTVSEIYPKLVKKGS